MMAVFRIAVALVLIYNLAGAKRSNSEHQKQKITSTNNNQGLKSNLKWPTCPPWKYHKYNNSSCVCGSGLDDIVVCGDNHFSTVLSLYVL